MFSLLHSVFPVIGQSHIHPEGGLSDSDICGRYQGFLTSFYNRAYGEIIVLTKIK